MSSDTTLSYSLGVLEVLDPVMATLTWDTRDLGSRTEKILSDHEIMDPAWASYRGILQILILTQQHGTVS